MIVYLRTCLFLVFLVALSVSCSNMLSRSDALKKDPVYLILDTDLGPDYDDVGAMALMHALADSGQVDILATLSSNHDENVIPCMEAINTYFNRPSLPVGGPKSGGGVKMTSGHKIRWTEVLPAKYPHRTAKTSDAPDAVEVYRKVLSKQKDSSVVICTIGFFTNLKDLLESGPDRYSRMSGKELVARKVKRVVAMAGAFPAGREFNVYCDTPASIVFAEQWPTEVVFSGFEIGDAILTGKRLVEADLPDSPVKETYQLCLAEGDPQGRKSWDQTAVLVAIKGYEPYYKIERGRFKVVDEQGNNSWEADETGTHFRLIEKVPAAQMARLIEDYMMYRPKNR